MVFSVGDDAQQTAENQVGAGAIMVSYANHGFAR